MPSLSFDITLCSDVGCVREQNEDMVLCNNDLYRDAEAATHIIIDNVVRMEAIVADGMGGHNGGDYASELAAQSFDDWLMSLGSGVNIIEEAKRWAESAHQMLLLKGAQMSEFEGMGTTFEGFFSYEGHIYHIHIGDSRTYRLRNGILKQISRDHSMRELCCDRSLAANLIVNSLGAGETTFAEVSDMTETIMEGDLYMVCSDGLSDMVDDDAIEQLLQSSDAAALVRAAKANGGKDNVSVIAIKVTL